MKKLTVAELINVSGAGDSEIEISFEGNSSFAGIFPTDISSGVLASVDLAKLSEGVELVQVEIIYA